MDFENQVAVVTGAGSGIGKAITLALSEKGASLYLVGRTRAKLEEVAAEARRISPAIRVCPTDLTRDGEIAALEQNLVRESGRVDILIHCAGVIAQGKLECASIFDLDEQYRSNVRGPYLLTQALLPMLKTSRGQIVFVNSSAGLNAKGGAGQFSATQHAMKAIADSLREEVNSKGIRILNLFPGRTATPRQRRLYELENREYRPDLLMQATDVASVVLFALAMPATAEITNVSMRPFLKSY